MHILHCSVTLDALYDSADSFPQPRCHPDTRTEMLAKLYNWCTGEIQPGSRDGDEDEDEDQDNSDSTHPMCWLRGPARAGKSAIMQTLCRQLQDTGRLGGAFFFKRDHPTRGNAKALFTTLAYQLAENNDRLKPIISRTVERCSSIVGREMEVQLDHLIVEPCSSLTNSPPSIFLIDGLDECQHENVQSEILRLIGNAARQYPARLRFLVASRPEAAISETIADPAFDGLLHRLNVERSFSPVQTYSENEFARIHREHRNTMGSIPTPWPSADILDSLVKKSSGYFVYASTVIKFVDDKSFRPTERLDDLLTSAPTHHSRLLTNFAGDLEGTTNPLQVIAATTVTLIAVSLELSPNSAHDLLGDLACGCLRPLDLRPSWIEWGQLVRCSPYPNSPLLCTLDEFTPVWERFNSEWSLRLLPVELHDVIQWLKAHPNPPMTLIARWEGYLVEGRNQCKQAGIEIRDNLESRWQSFKFWRPRGDPSEFELGADFDEGARSYSESEPDDDTDDHDEEMARDE
ncbi:hypothetical protein C8F04DRAFT_1395579 [Mycena alexandri]|uniref:Nephrocystin 3-like N-terminal domain-containing protein n=1 Tax=Mycena alexandri TaxID=1745969 RepID=A0AAD6SUK4_9AGAR|nr:hypothetical protein C8F04DRAFT_1395579 [Mycena alexandri]